MLRNLQTLVGVCIAIHAGPSVVRADIYTFEPKPTARTTPGDLWTLDQGSYYTWGLNWSLPDGEQIVSAVLTYANVEGPLSSGGTDGGIDAWRPTRDNHLYTHLLDSVAPLTVQPMPMNWVDSGEDRLGGEDIFGGQGVLLGDYNGPVPGGENVSYVIPTEYLVWLSDGHFGFGIDPDFDLTNDGITLRIKTQAAPIPAPGAVGLGAIGLVLVAGRVKRRIA